MVDDVFDLGNYFYYLTIENKNSKFDGIEKKKNKKFSELVGTGGTYSFIGHLSGSDFEGRESVFAEEFFKKINNADYDVLRDKVLTINYKLPASKYVHVSVYKRR